MSVRGPHEPGAGTHTAAVIHLAQFGHAAYDIDMPEPQAGGVSVLANAQLHSRRGRRAADQVLVRTP